VALADIFTPVNLFW